MVPTSICNHHLYNGCGPFGRDNTLNWFGDPLDACAVAGGHNFELISQLTFHANEYEYLNDN